MPSAARSAAHLAIPDGLYFDDPPHSQGVQRRGVQPDVPARRRHHVRDVRRRRLLQGRAARGVPPVERVTELWTPQRGFRALNSQAKRPKTAGAVGNKFAVTTTFSADKP
jgi:hypothetical protein